MAPDSQPDPVEPNLNDAGNEAEPRSERADNEVEPTLSDFMSAYVAIEAYREDDRLTPDQREILNEAHVVLQECEAMDDVQPPTDDEDTMEVEQDFLKRIYRHVCHTKGTVDESDEVSEILDGLEAKLFQNRKNNDIMPDPDSEPPTQDSDPEVSPNYGTLGGT
jgi:hypothetical protein